MALLKKAGYSGLFHVVLRPEGGREGGVPVELTTDRLLLRPVYEDDVPQLVRIMTEPASLPFVLRWQRDKAGVALGMSRWAAGWRTVAQMSDAKEQTGFKFVIVERATNEIIGTCGLVSAWAHSPEAVLDWHIGTAHAGRGFGTEAGRALLRLAFGRQSVSRVYADCFANNAAMTRVLQKLGMQRDRSPAARPWRLALRYRHFRHTVRYEIRRRDWHDDRREV